MIEIATAPRPSAIKEIGEGTARRVVIAGGGIGGLALARALRAQQARCHITVLERRGGAPVDRHGVTLTPNGLRALDAMGLLPGVVARGRRLNSVEVFLAERPDRSLRFEFADLSTPQPFAIGILPRALREAMLEGLADDVEILPGHELTQVVHERGRGARRDHAGTGWPSAPARRRGHRRRRRELGAAPTRERTPHRPPERRGVPAHARRAGAGCRRRTAVSRGGSAARHRAGQRRPHVPVLADPALRGGGAAARPFDEFKASLVLHAPVASEPLRAIRGWQDVHSAAVDLCHSRRWCARGVALLGDAVHASTPSLAQGANMALVDAACLGTELAAWSRVPHVGAEALAEALARYQGARRDQATFQHFAGKLLLSASRTRVPLLARAGFSLLGGVTRLRPFRNLMLSLITGLRPRSYEPSRSGV